MSNIVSKITHRSSYQIDDGGVVEGGVFAGEDVSERVADEMGVAYHQVGLMMGVTVDPCVDSAVGDVVAKFGGESHVQRVAGIPFVNGRECWKVMCHYYNLFCIARFNGILYESEVLFKLICYISGSESVAVI